MTHSCIGLAAGESAERRWAGWAIPVTHRVIGLTCGDRKVHTDRLENRSVCTFQMKLPGNSGIYRADLARTGRRTTGK